MCPLAASGHIAGVINPASKNRRSFRTGGAAPSPQQWLEASVQNAGSWWKHWTSWVKPRSGCEVVARTQLGNGDYRELEPAPGAYVREGR